MIEKVQFGGNTLIDITTRQWHQCPEKVREYLANVTYDPSDYSNSDVSEYVETPVRDSRPIGNTVNGVTYYNEVPNVATPIVSGAVKPLDYLRWLNTTTINVRDLGGWACDGGTVKYGKLIRGGECVASDKSLMVDTIGIKHELSLRGKAEAPQQYSLWGVDFTCTTNYVWMNITAKETWKEIIRCVFDNVIHEKPLYFHCAAGADRTGTVAVMLEALLGMSQSDIDKDYELTNFYTGTGTAAAARLRNEDEYKNYISAIKAVPLEGGLSDSFRNRAVSFMLSLGFTIAEINAFRTAMINGNPTAITVSMQQSNITKSLTNVSISNNSNTVDKYQPFNATLLPINDTNAFSISVTMGGVDITHSCFEGNKVIKFISITKTLTHCSLATSGVIIGQSFVANFVEDSGYTMTGGTVSILMGGIEVSTQYYSNGKIAIPNVTGDLVITASAVISEVIIEPNIVKGSFAHAVGDDFTTGETSTTSYAKSSVIDVSLYSWVRVRHSGVITSDGSMYCYFAGDDNIIDSSAAWSFKTVSDKMISLPSGTTKIRFRGYSDFFSEKDNFTITAG